MDIDDFLRSVAENRRQQQARERTGYAKPPDLLIPPALQVAIKHRFRIRPVLARSPLANNSAYVGMPACDQEQIEFWVATYGPDTNYALDLGESSAAALEVHDIRNAFYSLASLEDDNASWRFSLQFTAGNRWFVLFDRGPVLIRSIDHCGLKLHTRGSILIPPSLTVAGEVFRYVDPRAPLLPIPSWLHDVASA